MPSKYDALLPTLQPLPVQDHSYQARVEVFKDSLIHNSDFVMSPTSLGKEYARLRKAKEAAEEEVSRLNLCIEGVTQLLVETNEEDNPEWGTHGAAANTLRLVTGDKIEVRKEPYATVEDKDANRLWAVSHGLERLLTLPWQTINSETKKLLLAGEAEPDGVKVFVKTKLVYTALKNV